MNIQVTFRGMSSTTAIAGHVEDRLAHAARHLNRNKEARAVLSPDETGFRADLELNAGDLHLRAHASHADLYNAINAAAVKLGRQLDHHHDKKVNPRAAET